MGTARNGDVELAFDVEGDGPGLLLIAGTAAERGLWSLGSSGAGAIVANDRVR
jgi:hypothetical protein